MFPKNTKVLVVDDMSTMRRIIKNSLSDLGMENIVEAGDGVAAWEKIEQSLTEESPIEIVLSDWNMPNMPGIELLEKMRGDERTKALPFLMLTAKSEPNELEEAKGCGANGYLTKPFSSGELEEELEIVYKDIFGSN